MAKKGTLTVRVVSDTKPAEQGMKKFAKTVDSTGDKLQTAGKKMTLFATVPIAAAMGFATKAASDLNETVSKSNTVFGESAKEVEDWGDGAAESFGQSKREALDAASGFGNMFVQLGIGADQAADMSMQMTELASDFASFHNADITQVIEAQSAAFRGEYDALQRFIPTINAATVEEEALAQTGKATTKELTAQEKALAVQTIMLEGAGDAMGDFDRTSESAANQTRIAKAAMEDASAEIGGALLPLLAKAAGGVADLASGFGDLPTPIQNGVLALAGIVAAAGPAATAVGTVMKGAKGAASGIETMRLQSMYLKGALGGAGGLTATLGAVGVVVAAGALLYQDYSKTKAEASRITDLYVSAIQDENGELKRNIDLTTAQELANKDYASAIREAGISFESLTQGVRESGDAIETLDDLIPVIRDGVTSASEALDEAGLTGTAFGDALLELSESMSRADFIDLINDLDGLSDAHDKAAEKSRNQEQAEEDLGGATEDTAGKTAAAVGPAEDLAEAMEEETSKADVLEDAVKALTDSFNTLIGVHISAQEAAIGTVEDFEELTDTLNWNGATLDITTAKGRANQEQLLKTSQGVLSHVEALAKEGASTDEVNWFLTQHTQHLKDVMKQAGFTDEEIAEYIETLGLTPENIATSVELYGTEQAEAALSHLTRNRQAFIDVQLEGGTTGGLQLRHSGGPVRANTAYLVGRPNHEELFVPDQSGRIISGPQTDRIMGRSGGATAVGGGIDYGRLAATLADALRGVQVVVSTDEVASSLRSRERAMR